MRGNEASRKMWRVNERDKELWTGIPEANDLDENTKNNYAVFVDKPSDNPTFGATTPLVNENNLPSARRHQFLVTEKRNFSVLA
jgi:hypothetical protein